jgi:hypothetical protein
MKRLFVRGGFDGDPTACCVRLRYSSALVAGGHGFYTARYGSHRMWVSGVRDMEGFEMNNKNIIRMAQEAGLHLATDVNWMPIIGLEYAEKFAAIAYAAGAAAEREAIAKIADGWPDYNVQGLAEAIRAREQQ